MHCVSIQVPQVPQAVPHAPKGLTPPPTHMLPKHKSRRAPLMKQPLPPSAKTSLIRPASGCPAPNTGFQGLRGGGRTGESTASHCSDYSHFSTIIEQAPQLMKIPPLCTLTPGTEAFKLTSEKMEEYYTLKDKYEHQPDCKLAEFLNKITSAPVGPFTWQDEYFSHHPGHDPEDIYGTRPISLPFKSTIDRENINFIAHPNKKFGIIEKQEDLDFVQSIVDKGILREVPRSYIKAACPSYVIQSQGKQRLITDFIPLNRFMMKMHCKCIRKPHSNVPKSHMNYLNRGSVEEST
eukprot:GHVR01013408.1.p1 GENE.GHVR01013408.1~~GHVR01013408.1.p1  ORF type:complete len:293 (-),score=20.77 GHVR01013408.1:2095-2973(-)